LVVALTHDRLRDAQSSARRSENTPAM
jgi:hypothetical protein